MRAEVGWILATKVEQRSELTLPIPSYTPYSTRAAIWASTWAPHVRWNNVLWYINPASYLSKLMDVLYPVRPPKYDT